MKLKTLSGLVLGPTVMILVAGCAADAPEAEVATVSFVEGECGDVYGADICTWAEVEGDRVVSLGANIPMASVENAPPEMEMVWPPLDAGTLAMPAVVQDQTGVQSLKIYWEAHGHPPGPYLVPHFDFHFYTIGAEETDAIDCSDESKPASPPAGYALPDVDIPEIGHLVGLCVPAMGMHALLQEELEGEDPFSGTMVIGYYADESIFFEPMITKDLLMERATFSLDMPMVPGVEDGVTIPAHFEAEFDAASDSYRFVFTELGGN